MKIIINGEIIETENIWRITEIKQQYLILMFENDPLPNSYQFSIHFFNDKKLSYKIDVSGEYGLTEEGIAQNVFDMYDDKSAYLEKAIKAKDRITKFHDDIVAIWSNNQTNLPVFKL